MPRHNHSIQRNEIQQRRVLLCAIDIMQETFVVRLTALLTTLIADIADDTGTLTGSLSSRSRKPPKIRVEVAGYLLGVCAAGNIGKFPAYILGV